MKTSLYKANAVPAYAHFITSGMASIVALSRDGEMVEVALTGRDSLVVKSPVALNECNTREAGSFCRESAYSLLTIRLQERFME